MNESQMQPIGAPPVVTAPRPAATQRDEIPGIPQDLLERARAAQATHSPGARMAQAGPPAFGAMQAPQRAVDPLSQPFKLPSNGLYYQRFAQGHDGEILISPMRGEQEETVASAADLPNAGAAALRHVTSQCFEMRGVPFSEMLLHDWNASLLQFYAQSVGDDTLHFGKLTHPGCAQADDYTLKLSELPSVVIRAAAPGETPNWPTPVRSDDELAVLAVEGKSGVEVRILPESEVPEPFKLRFKNGTTIAWRHARVRDLVATEEYIASIGGINVATGKAHVGKFNNFLMALHIVAINEKPIQSAIEALTWVKSSPTYMLEWLRKDIIARSFGYETEPRLRCKKCGGSWKVEMPEKGELFRSPGA